MSTQRFFRNPHFLAYARLLHQLHFLIRGDADETQDGEALRERMDEPAEYLAPEEVESLHGISADFYTLGGPAWLVQPLTPVARAELNEALDARNARNFAKALDLLRKNQAYRDPAGLTYARGSIWSEAGEHEIAADFFQRAKELAPENTNYAYIWLDALSRSNAPEALTTARNILLQPGDHPAKLVLKAAEIEFSSTRQLPNSEAEAVVRGLVPVFEEVVMRLQTSGEARSSPSLLIAAIAQLGICHEQLGDAAGAISYFDRGLQLFPNNDVLLTARGIQRYGSDTASSIQDFQEAVRLRSRLMWPYFFLAHNYLLHDQFDDCLLMANRALPLATSTALRANCLEWIAICQANLGHPPETVRAAFHAARQLAPENQRIAKNLQLFESSVAETPPSPVPWERVDPETVRSLGQRELQPAA
jgi:tetratricopeptide (TPR) repeat protein